MENWVEPGQPREEHDKAREFIIEHRIFDAKPRHGVLEDSGRCTVTLVYKPKAAGRLIVKSIDRGDQGSESGVCGRLGFGWGLWLGFGWTCSNNNKITEGEKNRRAAVSCEKIIKIRK